MSPRQMISSPSLQPLAMSWPSRDITKPSTMLPCPSNFFNKTPSVKSHNRSVLSYEPVTIRRPSGKTATATTASSWSLNVRTRESFFLDRPVLVTSRPARAILLEVNGVKHYNVEMCKRTEAQFLSTDSASSMQTPRFCGFPCPLVGA